MRGSWDHPVFFGVFGVPFGVFGDPDLASSRRIQGPASTAVRSSSLREIKCASARTTNVFFGVFGVPFGVFGDPDLPSSRRPEGRAPPRHLFLEASAGREIKRASARTTLSSSVCSVLFRCLRWWPKGTEALEGSVDRAGSVLGEDSTEHRQRYRSA
jgi:hypothetical protein